MNIANFKDDSDTSDDDYVPEGTNAELPSEEESDGVAEDPLPEFENVTNGTRVLKRKKKTTKSRKKRKTNERSPTPESPNNDKTVTEKDKQETDDLWASFMKDTGFKTRAERSQTASQQLSQDEIVEIPKNKEPVKTDSQKTVKVTQVYNFAGEEVKVEKEILANSKVVKLTSTPSSSETSSRKSAKSGGLDSILNQLGKKPKISTLEKSKLDWENFKNEENIQDELKAYSKSKDGYLERQDFLQRADIRRFEIEKDVRSTLRNNRMNNVNM